MRPILIIIFLISSVLCFSAYGQSASEKLIAFQNSHHLEKLYINHDKPYYRLGDTIWCKAYYLDAKTHKVFDISPLVFVEWISPNNNLVFSHVIKIHEGKAIFEMPLDLSLPGGSYTLRAYTQYQKNFNPAFIFEKKIEVFKNKSIAQDFAENEMVSTVNFYPEGGYMVNGISNRIVYELQFPLNSQEGTSFSLVDDEGQFILETNLIHENIGVLEFIPKAGRDYFLKADWSEGEREFSLPKALDRGYVLNVNSSGDEYIYVSFKANSGELISGANLIGHIRGEIILDLILEKSQTFRINRSQVPSGILHFTLFNNKGEPVCERLCFNHSKTRDSIFDVSLSKVNYDKREKVDLTFRQNEMDSSAAANLSVSVFNTEFFKPDMTELNIANYLLLQSDLEVDIKHISRYFDGNEVWNDYLLDLIMMTKSWRRFKWQEVLKDVRPEIKYGTQENMQFLGMVKNAKKNIPIKAKVSLVAAGEDLSNAEMITGPDGVFYFTGFDFPDTTNVIIQAYKYDEDRKTKEEKLSTKNVKIELVALDTFKTTERKSIEYTWRDADKIDPDTETEKSELIAKLVMIDSLAGAEWSIDIDEILIKESRYKTKQERNEELRILLKKRGMAYTNLTQKFYVEDIPGASEAYDIFHVVTTAVPKLIVAGGGAVERHLAYKLRLSFQDNLSGAGSNRYVGIPLLIDYSRRPNVGEKIDPKKIFAIEVRYGIGGGILYVNVISKNPNDLAKSKKRDNIISIEHPGYYQAREFYSPTYDQNSQPTPLDQRTTLYWNPSIDIEEEEVNISFFTSDAVGEHLVVIEGITQSGIPFVKKLEFPVK